MNGSVGAIVAGSTDAERARAALHALERHFRLDERASLYAETAPHARTRSAFLWPFSQVVAAYAEVVEQLNESESVYRRVVRDGFANYWDDTRDPSAYSAGVARRAGKASDRYYDDNAWVGLELVRGFRRLGDASLLDSARRVFAFAATGWDDDSSHAYPGGVFWVDARNNRDRNVVSNAPNGQLALNLYEFTREHAYLDWAERIDRWVDNTLRDPADGLYWDHVTLDGAIDTTKWSYCQGTVIGLKLLLGDVQRAEQISATALHHYERVGYLTQDLPFNVIFFRNLLALVRVSEAERLRDRVTDALRSYADQAWASYRNADDLFVARADGRAHVVDQAAAVQLYAMASSNATRRA